MKPSGKGKYQRTRISGLLRYEAKNGTVTYHTHFRKEGANRWVSHGVDFALAQKRHHELMASGPAAVSRLTASQAHERWRTNYVPTRRRPKDQRNTAARWRLHVEPVLGGRLLPKLTGEDIRRCARILGESKLSPRSQAHALADLRCFLNWCVEAGLLDRSPFPRRVMPRVEERPPNRLTDEEVEAILAVSEPHGFVIRFYLGTGLRWGEGCRAQRAHVQGDVLTVARTKNGRVRRVPLVNPVAGLSLLPDVTNRVGRLVPYSEGNAAGFSRAVMRKSGVQRFHVHRLRHTFACKYLEAGGSLIALQQILGHAGVETTQRYARLSDEHVRKEARQLTAIASD
jgi:integrase